MSSIAPSFWPEQLDERWGHNKIENTEKGSFFGVYNESCLRYFSFCRK